MWWIIASLLLAGCAQTVPVQAPVQQQVEQEGPILLADSEGLVEGIADVPTSGGWINSGPLDIDRLRAEGKTVLVYFWTNGCINCIRDIPRVQELWQDYEKEELVVIGVHTAEFFHEEDPATILAFAQKNGITFPIMTDADKTVWRSFGNHYWPAKYLTGPDGHVVYTHFGEGSYEKTEAAIRAQLGMGNA